MGLRTLMTGIQDNLDKMIDRSKSMQAYLNGIVYAQYQNAQRERWMTENASEGDRWKPLNANYALYKTKRFSDYDGAGRKMLIATGRLFKSVIGPGGDHRKIVTSSSIEISWTTPYSPYVNDVRPFNAFGIATMKKIYDGVAQFIIKGIMRNFA